VNNEQCRAEFGKWLQEPDDHNLCADDHWTDAQKVFAYRGWEAAWNRRASQPAPQQDELTYIAACNLAKAIYAQHYREGAEDWRVLPDTRGVISQISNMVAGMTRVKTQPAPQQPVWTPEQIKKIKKDAAEMRAKFRHAPVADMPQTYVENFDYRRGFIDGMNANPVERIPVDAQQQPVYVCVPSDCQIAEIAVAAGLPYGPDTWNALCDFAGRILLLMQPAPQQPSIIESHQPFEFMQDGFENTIEDYAALMKLENGNYAVDSTVDAWRGFQDGATWATSGAASFVDAQQERDSLQWKKVNEHGNPPEGLYIAIYSDGTSLPVALLSYGDFEYYTDDTNQGDDDGMVRGFGWSEQVDTPEGEYDSMIYVRDVVAYIPINFSGKTPAMIVIRAAMAAQGERDD
jgi:hypothetical protein